MTFIYGVVAIVLGLGAFIVYAPQIEAWNKRHLLSRGQKVTRGNDKK